VFTIEKHRRSTILTHVLSRFFPSNFPLRENACRLRQCGAGSFSLCNLLLVVLSKFDEIDLYSDTVDNHRLGSAIEELIRRFSEASNETAGGHFTLFRGSIVRATPPATHSQSEVEQLILLGAVIAEVNPQGRFAER
jgi:hypothetical protein